VLEHICFSKYISFDNPSCAGLHLKIFFENLFNILFNPGALTPAAPYTVVPNILAACTKILS